MTCEDIDKIKDILKSGDYDLACQLWIGGHPRTGNLAELASIIYANEVYSKINHDDKSMHSFKLNKDVEIIINISGLSVTNIQRVRVYYKNVKIWSIINNSYENKDVLHAATNVALNYMIYDEFKSSRLDCGIFISSIVIQGLPNQSELFNEPIKT